MANFWNDVRYAWPQLRKSPGFMLTAVLTLALGIGVNAAIFTVFNKVLLHTMPVQKPGELVLLAAHSQYETGSISTDGGDNHLYFSYPAYRFLHDNNHALEDLAAAIPTSANLVSVKDADRVNVLFTTGNYLNLMGVRPVLGRLLTPADDVYHAANPVAVLSEDYWKSKFGSDPAILNQTVKISGVMFTVVGVVRHSGLLDSEHPAAFLPLSTAQSMFPNGKERLNDSLFAWAILIGRLRNGVSRSQAETQLNTLWWNWRRDTLQTYSHHIGDKSGWLKTHLSLQSGSRGVQVNPGFAVSHVLTFRIDASALGKTDAEVKEEYETLAERILHEPGVQRVVYAMNGMMTGNQSGSNVTVSGYKDTGNEPMPDLDNASAGFFSAMKIPLIAGREFNDRDTLASPKVAIVDQKFVNLYFGGDAQKALRSQFGFGSGNVKTDIQIVGVIPSISAVRLSDPASRPFIYLPYAQSFSKDGKAKGSHPASFYVLTGSDSAALAGTLNALLHRLDPRSAAAQL